MIKKSKSFDHNTLYEIAGWYGMLALISAYGLASFKSIPADGLVYQLLNLTGSTGLMLIAFHKGVTQSVLLNIFWIAIGVVAIARLFL
ncbi:hypothetical protein KDA06_04200 [Candidatus Saccharibacteria bacterium]|jgi:hypothetical protein|nr:hypothetical protein [Candidatus Saccharibacteria bacterium]HPR09460.1 hypothetical protein [Candidatus Saccharibacteria bacterium]